MVAFMHSVLVERISTHFRDIFLWIDSIAHICTGADPGLPIGRVRKK
jgi:hypothetical protein